MEKGFYPVFTGKKSKDSPRNKNIVLTILASGFEHVNDIILIGLISVDVALFFNASNHHNINGETRKDEIEKIIKQDLLL